MHDHANKRIEMPNSVSRNKALGEVLIVEDTPNAMKLLSAVLSGAGYAVRQAASGELALWSAQFKLPELVLLDITMPVMDGFEVCRRLKGDPKTANVPVIFLSALDAIEDKVLGFKLGAVDYIAKPYQPEEVLARVRTHITLARLQKELEDADRVKSAFLATMSHELRTPLNAILGFCDMMRSEMFGPIGNRRYHEYLENIYGSGSLLLSLVNDLLDFSKLEAGQYVLTESEFDVGELIDGCADLTAATAAAGELTLEKTLADGLPLLMADGRAVRQIILNLLSNAVKFTPSGGKVTIAVRMEDGEMAFSVSDTGIGIAPDAIERITKPFQQADASIARRFGGSGLGLAISANLLQLHGARLTIDSKVGEGTTFTAWFPAHRTRENLPA